MGGRIGAELGQRLAHRLGQALVEVGGHLAQLHQGPLHVAEGGGHVLGGAHLELGVEGLAPLGRGEGAPGPVAGVADRGPGPDRAQPGTAPDRGPGAHDRGELVGRRIGGATAAALEGDAGDQTGRPEGGQRGSGRTGHGRTSGVGWTTHPRRGAGTGRRGGGVTPVPDPRDRHPRA